MIVSIYFQSHRSFYPIQNLSRQKRQRKTQDTWGKWTLRHRMRTTQAPNTQESITVNLPDWVSPYTIETPGLTYTYHTRPKPIFIPRYTPRTSRSSRHITTTEQSVTQSLYKPWNPVTVSTTSSHRYPTRQTTPTPTLPRTNMPRTTMPRTTMPTTTRVQARTIRIQPGTIVMMDSEYLKQKYIQTGLATTFHRALLADYFGLSENEMKRMGMTVVAWGFSYQVKDKKTSSRGRNRAPKYFCDFKFRSSTFNAGYVGADISMNIAEFDG